jgi:hypothetical protein
MLDLIFTIIKNIWPFLKESALEGGTFKDWLKRNWVACIWLSMLTVSALAGLHLSIRALDQNNEIVRVLTGPGLIQTEGRLTLTKIYERFENIYKGIQAIDKQFFMHPYAGLRFEFNMVVREMCMTREDATHDMFITSDNDMFITSDNKNFIIIKL